MANPNNDIIGMRKKVTDVIERWASSGSRKTLIIAGSRQVGKIYSVEEFENGKFRDHFL